MVLAARTVTREGLLRIGRASLPWLGVLACASGLIAQRMWVVLPWARFAETLVLAALVAAGAGLLRRWRGWAWADGLALLWFCALVFFAGVLPVIATLQIGAFALAAGSCLIPRGSGRFGLALAVGLVLIGGVLGWTLRIPLHHGFVYWPLMLGFCVWRAPLLRQRVGQAVRDWRVGVDAAPGLAGFAVALVGLASIGAWLPTLQADDLAYHLALPSQLLQHAVYVPDPAQQIWALAPWLGDVLQGVAQVLAGRETRGPLNMLWLIAAAMALWNIVQRLRASRRIGWLTVGVFASLPLLAALSAGMQTELPASALLAALAVVILGARAGANVEPAAEPGVEATASSLFLAGAVLVAGLIGLKLGHALAALALLLWALLRAHQRVAWPRMLAAIGMVVVLVGSSYFFAWQISGNPLLPIFNDVFHSTVLPSQQLHDARWHAGLNVWLPWAITFDTERYLEGWAGGFGFVLVALAGVWLLAIANARTRGLALAASVALLLPMLPMQYARYAFPGLVVLLPALLIATDAAIGTRWTCRIGIGLCVLNLAFQANSSWVLHVHSVRSLIADGGGVATVYRRYAPERALIADLQRRDPGDSIVLALDPRHPAVAELGGRGRNVAWYAPTLEQARIAADADPGGAAWQRLIADVDARWLLLRPAQVGPALRAGLQRSGARPVSEVGAAQLWSVAAPASTPSDATP